MWRPAGWRAPVACRPRGPGTAPFSSKMRRPASASSRRWNWLSFAPTTAHAARASSGPRGSAQAPSV
eukprot:8390693-Lingulodinium_polyedra.AAC.1